MIATHACLSWMFEQKAVRKARGRPSRAPTIAHSPLPPARRARSHGDGGRYCEAEMLMRVPRTPNVANIINIWQTCENIAAKLVLQNFVGTIHGFIRISAKFQWF